MRASRLLSLLLLLQNRGRMTAAQLAAQLEVSQRTIYRDVESLNAAGIPIYADRGTGGGYELLAGYRTRLTGLTASEADSLFLTGLPSAAAELGLSAEMTATQLKLLAALPTALRQRAERIRARFHLDTSTWFHETQSSDHLAEIATATWNQLAITIRYRRWGERTVHRTLCPLGLVLKNGTWYLVATPDPTIPPRTYRVSRVEDITTHTATFERPDDFDLAEHWRRCSAEFEAAVYTGQATVRLSPYGLKLVKAAGDPVMAAEARRASQTATPEADGWITCQLPIEKLHIATHEFARFGPEVEVLDPPELRESIAEHARATARLYGAALQDSAPT